MTEADGFEFYDEYISSKVLLLQVLKICAQISS